MRKFLISAMIACAAVAAVVGATANLSPKATAEEFIAPQWWSDFRQRLATSDTAVLLISASTGSAHEGGVHRWLLADRVSGRVQFFGKGLGDGRNVVYVLDGQSASACALLYEGGECGRPKEYGPPARQLANEVMSGFANSTFSHDYTSVSVRFPFPWAEGIELYVLPGRPGLDKTVEAPGEVMLFGWGSGGTFQIQDVRWDVPLPPSFYQDTEHAAWMTAHTLEQYIAAYDMKFRSSGY